MNKERKYILSLDGGGFRGFSCLFLLNHVMRTLVDDPEEDPVPAPCEVFDLICGTSTGGLISILLGRLGLDCMTAISIYQELGPAAFGKDEEMMWGTILRGEKFSSIGLEALLTRVVQKYAGDAMALLKPPKSKPDIVEHRSTDTFVTVARAGTGSFGAVRSYAPPPGSVQDLVGHSWTIVEAARATSAAPMYFTPVSVGPQVFQDAGASGFNNPTSEALNEAEMRWAGRYKDGVEFVVLSLGTGLTSLKVDTVDDQSIKNSDDNKLKQTVDELRSKFKNIATAKGRLEQIASQFVAVATDTERTHADVLNRFNLEWGRRDDYFRFNPPQGLGDLDLADYGSEGLIEEITNVWLRSPAGQDATMKLYEKLQRQTLTKEPHERKKAK